MSDIVYNSDIAGIADRVERVRYEVIKSQSSNVSGMIPHDMRRARSYLTYLLSFHDFVSGIPQLDLPESTPRAITLTDPAVLPSNFENPDIVDLVRLLDNCRIEMVNSVSARQGSGINLFDSKRLTDLIEKASKLLDHIEQSTPVDFPESTPEFAVTGEGRLGVDPATSRR